MASRPPLTGRPDTCFPSSQISTWSAACALRHAQLQFLAIGGQAEHRAVLPGVLGKPRLHPRPLHHGPALPAAVFQSHLQVNARCPRVGRQPQGGRGAVVQPRRLGEHPRAAARRNVEFGHGADDHPVAQQLSLAGHQQGYGHRRLPVGSDPLYGICVAHGHLARADAGRGQHDLLHHRRRIAFGVRLDRRTDPRHIAWRGKRLAAVLKFQPARPRQLAGHFDREMIGRLVLHGIGQLLLDRSRRPVQTHLTRHVHGDVLRMHAKIGRKNRVGRLAPVEQRRLLSNRELHLRIDLLSNQSHHLLVVGRQFHVVVGQHHHGRPGRIDLGLRQRKRQRLAPLGDRPIGIDPQLDLAGCRTQQRNREHVGADRRNLVDVDQFFRLDAVVRPPLRQRHFERVGLRAANRVFQRRLEADLVGADQQQAFGLDADVRLAGRQLGVQGVGLHEVVEAGHHALETRRLDPRDPAGRAPENLPIAIGRHVDMARLALRRNHLEAGQIEQLVRSHCPRRRQIDLRGSRGLLLQPHHDHAGLDLLDRIARGRGRQQLSPLGQANLKLVERGVEATDRQFRRRVDAKLFNASLDGSLHLQHGKSLGHLGAAFTPIQFEIAPDSPYRELGCSVARRRRRIEPGPFRHPAHGVGRRNLQFQLRDRGMRHIESQSRFVADAHQRYEHRQRQVVLPSGRAAKPADIPLAAVEARSRFFEMQEMLAGALVCDRLPKQRPWHVQRHPNPLLLAQGNLQVDRQLDMFRVARAAGRELLDTVSGPLVLLGQLLLQPVKLHELLVREADDGLQVPVLVGHPGDRWPDLLDRPGRSVGSPWFAGLDCAERRRAVSLLGAGRTAQQKQKAEAPRRWAQYPRGQSVPPHDLPLESSKCTYFTGNVARKGMSRKSALIQFNCLCGRDKAGKLEISPAQRPLAA